MIFDIPYLSPTTTTVQHFECNSLARLESLDFVRVVGVDAEEVRQRDEGGRAEAARGHVQRARRQAVRVAHLVAVARLHPRSHLYTQMRIYRFLHKDVKE